MMTAAANRHPPTSTASLSATEREVLAFLLPLSPDYPEIDHWFTGKVVPGLRGGSRHIVRHERNGRIAALGIAKSEAGENKICTVRVAPEFVGRGLGVRVFDELMHWLGTDRPLATVSEGRLGEFCRIFDHYGFRLTSVHTGLYVPGRAEYVFNEPRSPWGQRPSMA